LKIRFISVPIDGTQMTLMQATMIKNSHLKIRFISVPIDGTQMTLMQAI